MILHTVVFSLKHERGSSEESDFLGACMELKQLPGVQNFRCYRQISEKSDFDFGLSMEFESDKAYRDYNGHPVHSQFVNTIWLPQVSHFQELDYVEYKTV